MPISRLFLTSFNQIKPLKTRLVVVKIMPKNIHHLTIGGQPAAPATTPTPTQPSQPSSTLAPPPPVAPAAVAAAPSVDSTSGATSTSQGSLHRNDSKKFLDNKSQSVSSKPRPPPLNVGNTTSPVNPAASTTQHDPLSNGLAVGGLKPVKDVSQSSGSSGGASGGGGSGSQAPAAPGAKLTAEQLKRQIDSTDCTDEQKQKIHKFLDLREQIGELNDDALNVEGELGSGNGGVVLKCRHRKLDIVMAKKVE